MPRGETEAPNQKGPAPGECGQVCHFCICRLHPGKYHAMAYRDLWESSTCEPTLDSHWIPHRTLSPASKPSRKNALGDTFILGSLLGMSNHPFWDPNFSPPFACGLLPAPYRYAHKAPNPNSKSCTEIFGPTSSPMKYGLSLGCPSHPWEVHELCLLFPFLHPALGVTNPPNGLRVRVGMGTGIQATFLLPNIPIVISPAMCAG